MLCLIQLHWLPQRLSPKRLWETWLYVVLRLWQRPHWNRSDCVPELSEIWWSLNASRDSRSRVFLISSLAISSGVITAKCATEMWHSRTFSRRRGFFGSWSKPCKISTQFNDHFIILNKYNLFIKHHIIARCKGTGYHVWTRLKCAFVSFTSYNSLAQSKVSSKQMEPWFSRAISVLIRMVCNTLSNNLALNKSEPYNAALAEPS